MLSEISGSEMGAFLPGLKKVGRYTSRVTGTIAKAFIPAGLVNAAAAFDPTKKKALANAKKSATELLKPTPAPVSKVRPKAKLAVSPAMIGIGVAALGALVFLGKRR